MFVSAKHWALEKITSVLCSGMVDLCSCKQYF